MASTAQTRAFVRAAAPLRPRPAARRPAQSPVQCVVQADDAPSRRRALQLGAVMAASTLLAGGASAAKVSKGFVPLKDPQDGYSFMYPFGWQEVLVDGQDVVFKDVIEPLESVSVGMVPTEKKEVGEFGDAAEVAFTLADKVLTAPSQQVSLIDAGERNLNGRKYYDFEFVAKSSGYTRHALASVTVGNGKFYTLLTGANEKRWGRMKDKIRQVVSSFVVEDRVDY